MRFVQCASGLSASAPVVQDADVARGLAKAADIAVETDGAVYLEMK